MQLKTTIFPDKSGLVIEHSEKIITIGSCFAENLSKKLSFYRFNNISNPFGVLYNPVSIYNSFKAVSENKVFAEDDLVYDQSEWHSFYHHSDFSSHKKEVIIKNINESIIKTKEYLSVSNLIIITYGTAYVYKHKDSGLVVSNCHKLPQNLFDHYLIGMYEAREFIQATVELIREINPKIKILFTLSPVRHWKNGATGNQLSKSILKLAIHDTIGENESIYYFPSYEIMLDDLRDYRFYARDLVHPNDIAVDYIWENFSESFFSDECKSLMEKIGKISSARNHKPRNTASEKHKEFLRTQLGQINELTSKYPHLELNEDKEYFEDQVKSSE